MLGCAAHLSFAHSFTTAGTALEETKPREIGKIMAVSFDRGNFYVRSRIISKLVV